MRLYVVRHGQTQANAEHRYLGSLDPELTLVETAAAQEVLLVAHGFVAKIARALVRQDFSDFFDWQLGNGHWLMLENVERIQQYELPVQNPLPRAPGLAGALGFAQLS